MTWSSTQVPEAVMDKTSPAYNKGRVFIHGASEITANAYKKRFQADLASFLRSRSPEMKQTGSMFLVCLGRTSVDPADQGGAGLLFGTHFQDAWDDLVQEVIEKHRVNIRTRAFVLGLCEQNWVQCALSTAAIRLWSLIRCRHGVMRPHDEMSLTMI